MEFEITKQKPFRKVYIEITNVCNLSCHFCAQTNRKKAFMTVHCFEEVIKKVQPFSDYIYLHILGEPLIHPDISQFFDLAEKYGLKVVLVTNGTKLFELGDMLLSKKALHKINVSLHALEANPTLDKDNYLGFCFSFCKKASGKGVVSVMRLWNGGTQNKLNKEIEEKMHKAFSGDWKENTKGFTIGEKLFLEYADRFNWCEDNEKSECVRCYALKDQFGVLCDGSVVPCCIDSEGTLCMGNIFKQELSEILSGNKAKTLREGFDKGKAVFDTCKKCGFVRKRL